MKQIYSEFYNMLFWLLPGATDPVMSFMLDVYIHGTCLFLKGHCETFMDLFGLKYVLHKYFKIYLFRLTCNYYSTVIYKVKFKLRDNFCILN